MADEAAPPIRTISSREVYRNPWTRVREDVIERADGQRGIYGVVDKDPATLIIPLERSAEGDFLFLVEQFRYTVQQTLVEFPQGGWERSDVNPEELARGELREETGLTAGKMTHIGSLWIAYGVMKSSAPVRRSAIRRSRTWWGIVSQSRSSRQCCLTGGCRITAPLQRGACIWSGHEGRGFRARNEAHRYLSPRTCCVLRGAF